MSSRSLVKTLFSTCLGGYEASPSNSSCVELKGHRHQHPEGQHGSRLLWQELRQYSLHDILPVLNHELNIKRTFLVSAALMREIPLETEQACLLWLIFRRPLFQRQLRLSFGLQEGQTCQYYGLFWLPSSAMPIQQPYQRLCQRRKLHASGCVNCPRKEWDVRKTG